jgi:2-phospho-L-lactate guanylyltransferase
MISLSRFFVYLIAGVSLIPVRGGELIMWALLPLKNFANAKQRLSSVLSPQERCGLFQSMVKDVLEVLQGHPDIDNTMIVSDDPVARLLAQEYGAEFLAESVLKVSGLNESIQAAVSELSRRGIDEVMVVHGDLPLISSVEISRLVCAHRKQRDLTHPPTPALTLAPDDRREGSNCLLCTPASLLSYCYGANSFIRHAAQASHRGMSLQVMTLSGIACDIDTPEDLRILIERLDGQNNAVHTYRYIVENGLSERMTKFETVQFTAVDMQYRWVI